MTLEEKTSKFLNDHGLMLEADLKQILSMSDKSFIARKARGSLPKAYGKGAFVVYKQSDIAEWLTDGRTYSEMEANAKAERDAINAVLK